MSQEVKGGGARGVKGGQGVGQRGTSLVTNWFTILACCDVTEQWGSNKRAMAQCHPHLVHHLLFFRPDFSTNETIIHIRKLTKDEFFFSSPLDEISEPAVSMSTLSEPAVSMSTLSEPAVSMSTLSEPAVSMTTLSERLFTSETTAN